LEGDPMSDKVETAKLILEIKRRDDGALWTSHRPASPGDLERITGWPSNGLHQMSHALFVEFMRREAYTLVIQRLANGESVEDITIEDMDALIRARTIELAAMFAKDAVRIAIEGAR
jgi:hypothetical protein